MRHGRSEFIDRLDRPERSAAELGYRMAGEFEPVEAVWLTEPHNRETWPGCFDRAAEQFERFAEALRRFVRVELTQERGIETDDSWVRDYGPIFVVRDGEGEGPRLACHDFIFNGWGGKYGGAEAHANDDLVPQHVARMLGVPIWVHDVVLEGGSIDANGRGTILTTEQCLLNANRNPHLTRVQIERLLHDALGARRVIWLGGGIVGDDTDGHVDDVARFVSAEAILAARAPAGHPDHESLERNFEALRCARGPDGESFDLLELPVPAPVVYEYPADRFGPGGGSPAPAAYANFVIVNEGVLVPTFGQANDEAALRAVERALPGRTVVGIASDALVVGLGALHCLSMHQPRV